MTAFNDYILQQQITNLSISGTGGTNSNSIWVGTAAFSASGTYTLNHNISNINHFTNITLAGGEEYNPDIVAKVGTIYVKTGENTDTIYANGETYASGIAFNWMVCVSGSVSTTTSEQDSTQMLITGSGSERPAAGTAGRLFIPTDGYLPCIDGGSVWTPFVNNFKCGQLPSISSLTFVNPTSTTSVTLIDEYGSWLLTQSGTASTGEINALYVVSAPTPPYTFTIGVQVNFIYHARFGRIGMFLANGSSNPAFISFTPTYGAEALWLNIQKFNSCTSWNSNYVETPMSYPMVNGTFFLKMVDDSTNRNFFISSDCRNWGLIHKHDRTDFFTATHVGIGVGHSSSSIPSDQIASQAKIFHWSLT